MKAAVIHDWLTGMRGGEAVLESILDIFPDADIFTLVCDRDAVSEKIRKHKIHTSFLQKIPGVFKSYRNFLPLFPAAIESFNLKDYDLIISSSHCVAKSVKHNKSIKNFCYCHTPMRYAWDQFDNYFSREKNGALKFALISAIMPHLRRWDAKTSGRVSRYIANSNHVKKRIEKYYNAPAEVIYPPVDTNYYTVNHSQKREDFYLAVSALTEYKKIDFLVDAFLKMPKEHLVVIGTGPMLAQLEKKAQGNKNIHFLGKVPRDIIRDAYQRAKVFLFPGEEDFGITNAEAQACGTPVLAYNVGGATEVVIPGETGEFFDGTTEDFIKKLDIMRGKIYDVNKIRSNALRFSRESFDANLRKFLKDNGVNA